MMLTVTPMPYNHTVCKAKLTNKIILLVAGLAIATLSWQVQAQDAEYGFDTMQGSFGATITIPTNATQQTGLIKFSSLSPALLALISDNNGEPNMNKLRIIDSQGRVMPMSLRLPKIIETTQLPISVVSVQTDNPLAVEKLRQALRIEYEQTANQATQTSSLVNPTTNSSINVNLGTISSNRSQIDPNTAIHTWWLANPLPPDTQPEKSQDSLTLQLQFGKSHPQRPLRVQVYGSDDLQNWQPLNQSVISPFDNAQQTNTKPSQASSYSLPLNSEQATLRYWQVVTNQPVTLNQAIANQSMTKPNRLMTPATFLPVKDQPTHWQLILPQPALINGIEFSVPENQLWQINITTPNQNSADDKNSKISLANAQIDYDHSHLDWQGSVVKNLDLTGQMSQTQIPVTLQTSVYELYFLAQGTAPYQLVVHHPKANTQPSIALSDSQIKQLLDSTQVQEGQLQMLQPLADPNAERNNYKKLGLWGILMLILMILSSLAYRLYQQITAKQP